MNGASVKIVTRTNMITVTEGEDGMTIIMIMFLTYVARERNHEEKRVPFTNYTYIVPKLYF